MDGHWSGRRLRLPPSSVDQYAFVFQLKVNPQADAEPDTTKDVATQYVAGPVVAQVDTRRAYQYDEERRNNEERDTPPAISFEKDDRERKQQAPEGNI